MMFDEESLALCVGILCAIGLAIGFGLWAFRLIPWWAIFASGIAAPFVVVGGLMILGLMAWMASGSH